MPTRDQCGKLINLLNRNKYKVSGSQLDRATGVMPDDGNNGTAIGQINAELDGSVRWLRIVVLRFAK